MSQGLLFCQKIKIICKTDTSSLIGTKDDDLTIRQDSIKEELNLMKKKKTILNISSKGKVEKENILNQYEN